MGSNGWYLSEPSGSMDPLELILIVAVIWFAARTVYRGLRALGDRLRR